MLFTSTLPTVHDIEKVMTVVDTRVTYEMNRCLIAPYTDQDVSQALADLNPSKAPGPDGSTSVFFFFRSRGT